MEEQLSDILHYRDAAIVNNVIYFSAVEINGLFCKKSEQNGIELVSTFSGEEEIQNNLHSKVIEYAGKLYFIPLEGRGISIFDINDSSVRTVVYEQNIEFINAFLIETDILLIPMNSRSPFLLFHTINESYERLEKLEKNIFGVIEKEKIWFDVFSSIIYEETLYMILPYTNILFVCNLNDWSIIVKKFDENIKFNSITYLKEKIYLSTMYGSEIMEWDIVTQRSRLFVVDELLNKDIEEIIVTVFQNQIYIISSKVIVVFDVNKGLCIHKISIPDDFECRLTKYRLIAGINKFGDTLWMFSASGAGILCIKDNMIELIETKATDEIIIQIINNAEKRRKRNFKKEIEKDVRIWENQFEGADIRTLIWYCLEKN